MPSMKKPLVSSSFFSFPKLLLWSLPLGFFLVSTWLKGGLYRDTLRQLVWKTEEIVVAKVCLIQDMLFRRERCRLTSGCCAAYAIP